MGMLVLFFNKYLETALSVVAQNSLPPTKNEEKLSNLLFKSDGSLPPPLPHAPVEKRKIKNMVKENTRGKKAF